MPDQDMEGAIRNALVPAINDLEEQVAHLTAAVEYAAGRMPQEAPDTTEEETYPCPECGGDSLPAEWENPRPLRQVVGPIEMECQHGHAWVWPDGTLIDDTGPAPAQDDSRYPDDDPDVGYPGQAAAYLLANLPEPFDLTGMHIHLEGETLVLDTSGERFEPTDEWQEWTSEHFGKGKLGEIDWQDVGDTEEVWVPQAFKLPLAEFDEVFQ